MIQCIGETIDIGDYFELKNNIYKCCSIRSGSIGFEDPYDKSTINYLSKHDKPIKVIQEPKKKPLKKKISTSNRLTKKKKIEVLTGLISAFMKVYKPNVNGYNTYINLVVCKSIYNARVNILTPTLYSTYTKQQTDRIGQQLYNDIRNWLIKNKINDIICIESYETKNKHFKTIISLKDAHELNFY